MNIKRNLLNLHLNEKSFRFNVSLKCRVNIELFIYECLESTFPKEKERRRNFFRFSFSLSFWYFWQKTNIRKWPKWNLLLARLKNYEQFQIFILSNFRSQNFHHKNAFRSNIKLSVAIRDCKSTSDYQLDSKNISGLNTKWVSDSKRVEVHFLDYYRFFQFLFSYFIRYQHFIDFLFSSFIFTSFFIANIINWLCK